ncbi:hypothetical protein BDV93DRAFT_604206 [Ceratobasidium sp. AG-I]|nr:hypothetical protein BDV93DRAFT_604206 [Ceratobasidium sp. AG-I]
MQLKGLDVSIFGGSPMEKMEEYPYVSSRISNATGMSTTECWITSTSGVKFTIRWGSSDNPYTGIRSHVLACNVSIDGVFTERGLLHREDFENANPGEIRGYSLDSDVELPFCFGAREYSGRTLRPRPANQLNTITVELEWCRIRPEFTSKRPSGSEFPSLDSGQAASLKPILAGDAVLLGAPEVSERYLWYETYPSKCKKFIFVFHYAPKGMLIAQNIIPNPAYEKAFEIQEELRQTGGKRERSPSVEEIPMPTKRLRQAKPRVGFQASEGSQMSNIQQVQLTQACDSVLPLITNEVDPWRLGC